MTLYGRVYAIFSQKIIPVLLPVRTQKFNVRFFSAMASLTVWVSS